MIEIERLAHLAARAARCSVLHQRVGAVVVAKNRVLSVGTNKRKTHPNSPHPWSVHAEIDAILGLASADLRGATICVVRITKQGWFAMSRPCLMCAGVLREAGVRTVIYSDRTRALRSEVWS